MNKKITIICSTVLSAVIFTTGVYASQKIDATAQAVLASETTQLQSALDNSNILRSRYKVTSQEEEIAALDKGEIEIYSVKDNVSNKETPNAENAIKVYDVDLSGKSSLTQQFNKAAESRLLVEEIAGETAFVFMKQGQNIEVAREKINALNISEERKEKMRTKAAEKAGKWYVSAVKRYSSSEDANNFTDKTYITNLLNTNGITNVENIEYVYISNSEMLGIWVSAEGSEYIIPFVTTSRNDITSNNVYNLDTISDCVVK